MRFHLLAAIMLAGLTAPAMAQDVQRIDRRVDALEDQMRAVQRKVFPAGNVTPEILPDTAPPPTIGAPATSAVADLTARVDALEGQLASLTNQAEENANRIRQLEQGMTRLRAEAEERLGAIERAAAPAAEQEPAEAPADDAEPAASQPEPAPSSGDAAEDAYTAGYRLWQAGQYAEAQRALDAMAKKYPKHKRASWARNLAGRSLLDDGKPAAAAKALLANYQADPKGERAADSLFYLGQALVALKKPVEACQAYAELQDVYGASMRSTLKQSLPTARKEANCS